MSGYPEACHDTTECGVYNFYSNVCMTVDDVPTYESGCSDYNGFFEACVYDVVNNCEYSHE